MEKQKEIMVCVTRQKTCERLISRAHEFDCNARLHVVHVIRDDRNFLDNSNEGEALEYLFDVSKKYNAEMAMLKSEDVLHSLVEFARANRIDCIVTGHSPTEDETSLLYRLRQKLPEVEFITY